jgi:hypothetical protein
MHLKKRVHESDYFPPGSFPPTPNYHTNDFVSSSLLKASHEAFVCLS